MIEAQMSVLVFFFSFFRDIKTVFSALHLRLASSDAQALVKVP